MWRSEWINQEQEDTMSSSPPPPVACSTFAVLEPTSAEEEAMVAEAMRLSMESYQREKNASSSTREPESGIPDSTEWSTMSFNDRLKVANGINKVDDSVEDLVIPDDLPHEEKIHLLTEHGKAKIVAAGKAAKARREAEGPLLPPPPMPAATATLPYPEIVDAEDSSNDDDDDHDDDEMDRAIALSLKEQENQPPQPQRNVRRLSGVSATVAAEVADPRAQSPAGARGFSPVPSRQSPARTFPPQTRGSPQARASPQARILSPSRPSPVHTPQKSRSSSAPRDPSAEDEDAELEKVLQDSINPVYLGGITEEERQMKKAIELSNRESLHKQLAAESIAKTTVERVPGSPRPIVIDGNNVAWAHGNQQRFSAEGLKIVFQYFSNFGFEDITIFCSLSKHIAPADVKICELLHGSGILKWAIKGQQGQKNPYDDLYVIINYKKKSRRSIFLIAIPVLFWSTLAPVVASW
jgi:hypothetical protein